MQQICLPPRPAILACLIAACLAGCTKVPELDATIAEDMEHADYPALVPIETLLVQPARTIQTPEAEIERIENRRARLKARAKRLNTQIVDQETRARMQNGVAE